jgi:hypothetical protein
VFVAAPGVTDEVGGRVALAAEQHLVTFVVQRCSPAFGPLGGALPRISTREGQAQTGEWRSGRNIQSRHDWRPDGGDDGRSSSPDQNKIWRGNADLGTGL